MKVLSCQSFHLCVEVLLHIGVNVILYRIDPQFMAPDCKYYAKMTGKQKTTSIKYKTK